MVKRNPTGENEALTANSGGVSGPVGGQPDSVTTDDDAQEPVRLRFASLPLFVESYVLPNWRHPTNGIAWCGRWWEHAEAITRLSACWEAFEVMRREPAPALSVWWRDHLDVHMAALTRESGPFKQCDAERGMHRQQPIWSNVQPPAGLFPVDDDAEIGGRPAAQTKETR